MQNSLSDEITVGVIYFTYSSLLHTKLFTTVSSNLTFHKHGILFLSHLIFFNKAVAVHCRVGLGGTESVAICQKSSDSQQARRYY